LGSESLTKNWNDFPHLLADLDRSKNKNHTYKGKPIDVLELSAGTAKKIDWKCSTCEHEWQASGDSRVRISGCPACAGQRLHSDGRNSMAMTRPDLAAEYQGDATKVLAGTHLKLDWKCSTCEHEWQVPGNNRRTTGCPACYGSLHSDGRNSMAMTHPELVAEYQGDATKVVAGTHLKLDWRCGTCEHEWQAVGRSRTINKNGCPSCFGYLHSDGRNSMAMTHPDLATEYQGDGNLIVARTVKKLLWKCSICKHEWIATGDKRVRRGDGCTACSGRAVNNHDGRNSMAITHPELVAEYQGDATKVVAGTHKKLDWKCGTCEHEWQAQGKSRTRPEQAYGCPACAGFLHSDGRNSMAMTHPDLAKEYQGDATKLIAGTTNKLLWKCLVRDNPCGRKWITRGNARARGSGCPACAESGFKVEEPAYCYLLKYQFSDGTIRYKQGITNDVKRRVSQLSCEVNKVFPETKVTLIGQKYFEVGRDAKNLETYFLSLEDIRWTPDKKFDGFNEMYAEGILEAWAERL